MKLVILLALLSSLISCNSSADNKNLPGKGNLGSAKNEIVGVWELFKRSYRPSSEPSLVQANDKEYLEIKSDGTCQDGRYPAKWYLVYSEDYIIDSTSNVIFAEITNLDPNSYDEYDRKIKLFQVKVRAEKGIEYLYLTSLHTSGTRIYIRRT